MIFYNITKANKLKSLAILFFFIFSSYSQEIFAQSTTDTDGDGIIDSIDIDDDNDGVLDINEGICYDSNIGPLAFGSLPGSAWGTGYGTIFLFNNLTDNFSSTINVTVNPNLITVTPSNCNITADGRATITNINSTTLEQAKSTDEYLGINFTTKNNVYNASIDYFYFFRSVASNYNMTFSISSDNINFTDLATTTYSAPTGTYPTDTQAVDFPAYQLTPNTTYYLRIYIYGLASGTTASIDDIGIAFDWCEDRFTDADAIANRLDLDSDGDGCADAIEAGASTTATSTTVYNNGGAGADTNANGLLNIYEGGTAGTINYTSTYSNYALLNAINTCTDTDGDGIVDISDIDDDNDGVLDTIEAGGCFNSIPDLTPGFGTGFGVFYSFNSGLSDDWASPAVNNLIINPNTNLISGSNCTIAKNGANGNAIITNINSGTLIAAKADNEYIGFSFTTKNNVFNASIEHLFYYREVASNYTMTWAISSDNVNFTDLATSVYTGAVGSYPNNTVPIDISNFPLAPNTTYYIRIYMYGLASGTTAYIDNMGIAFDWCEDRFTDADAIPNRLDLDSDGDGCADAIEAGASTTATSTTVYNNGGAGADTNNNGLLNIYEGGTAGTINYNSTSNYALLNTINACTDTDGDGIPDVFDIDDDNDGVLDAVESPSCFMSANEWNTINKQNLVTITTELNLSAANTNLASLSDGIGNTAAATQFVTSPAQNQLNKEIYKIEFVRPTQLSHLYIQKTAATIIFGGNVMLQGSNDNLVWNNLQTAASNPANATNTTVNGAVSLTNSNVFTVNTNAAAYKYYRIFGVASASISSGIASEIYFDVNNTVYQPSYYPKATCTSDSDNDTIPNHLDLDSDGDGCADAIEAGASFTATSTTVYNNGGAGSDTNANGLLNVFEGTTAGTINYLSYYTNFATNNATNACTDTDGDGNPNFWDLDDDNDGVLDTDELVWCKPTLGQMVTPIGATVNVAVSNFGSFVPAVTVGGINATLSMGPSDVVYTSYNFSETLVNPIIAFYGVDFGRQEWFDQNDNPIRFRILDVSTPTVVNGNVLTLSTNPLLSTNAVTNSAHGRIQVIGAVTGFKVKYTWLLTSSNTDGHGFAFMKPSNCMEGLSQDTDTDTIPNHLDLDSDGDGCADAIEAGASTTATSTTVYNNGGAGTDTNTNGLLNSYESTTIAGAINYTSTYTNFALNDEVNACTDTDGDGVKDVFDIDDDNDGVLDIDEMNCGPYLPSTNSTSIAENTVPSNWTKITSSPDVSNVNTHVYGAWNVGCTGVVPAAPNGDTNFVSITNATQEAFGTTMTGLVIGKSYSLTYYYGRFGFGNTPGQVTVKLDATIIDQYTPTLTTCGWDTRTISFIPTATSHVIIFQSTGAGNTVANIAVPRNAISTSCDNDNDNIPNHLDLDSDNDGCADAIEAGSSTTATSTTVYNNGGAGTDTNANGLLNIYEGTTGAINYTSTYANFALNDQVNGCTDSDGDGVTDVFDLDDDNDGILDIDEMNCFTENDCTIFPPNNSFGITSSGCLGWSSANANFDFMYPLNNKPVFDIQGSGSPLYGLMTRTYTTRSNANYSFTVNHVSGNFGINGGVQPVLRAVNTANGAILATININPSSNTTLNFTTLSSSTRIEVGYPTSIDSNIGSAFWYPGDLLPENNPAFTNTNCSDLDTDNDGIPNRLDLDSDGDGCPDAKEAGVSGTLTSGSIVNLVAGSSSVTETIANVNDAVVTGPYGTNGLADSIETSSESGITAYPSTYKLFAISSFINACTDTDGDNVKDVFDIDDDNDGIIDAVESPSCFVTANEWNTINKNAMVTITTGLNVLAPNTNLASLSDGVGNTVGAIQFVTSPVQNQLNKEIFKIEFVRPTQLSNFYIQYVSTTAIFGGNVMLQGSNDNVVWNNLQTAASNPAITTNTTLNAGVSLTNSNVFAINTNAAAYKYYRIFGVASASIAAGVASEFYYDVNNTVYQPSYYPKTTCTSDLDNDTKLNHLDLDSDGDGCADAIEAGSSTTATSTTVFNNGGAGADTNGNGLLNIYEGATAGTINYNSTYINYALLNTINACTDTDGDSIPDVFDIDNDNDGILDAVESPSCFMSANEWNTINKSSFVTVTTDLNLAASNANLAALSDGIGNTTAAVQFAASQNQLNKEIFKMEFVRPTQLRNLFIQNTTTTAILGGNVMLQGSNDNLVWNNLQTAASNPATTTNRTANGSVSLPNSILFVVNTNAAPYKYYRIFGVASAIISNGIVSEIYYDVNIPTYQPSYYPKATCVSDLDNDTIPNHLDLDSDGDGCADAIEAGSSTTATSTIVYNNGGAGADTNANGLLNVFEGATAGTINYTSTYVNYALLNTINGCLDTDGDGVNDVFDIDDDNDGVLDIQEMNACETIVTPTAVTATTGYAGMTANLTISNTGLTGTGLAALATAPNTLDDSWYMAEPLTQGFLEYTLPANTNVGGVVLWNPDATNYGGGDGPIKDFYLEIIVGNVVTYTSPTYTTAKPTGSGSLPGSQVFYLPQTFTGTQKIRLNILSGWYDLNENNVNFIGTDALPIGTNISIAYNMTLSKFRVICAPSDRDTDGDNIPNRLDLDSDNDGCADAIEAGSSTTATSTTVYNNGGAGADTNANGLLNVYEGATAGTINYNDTYNDYALVNAINGCLDFDGDGVKDVFDLDDDNDGILDTLEYVCAPAVLSKNGVIITKPASVNYQFSTGTTMSNLIDNIDNNVLVIVNPSGTLTNAPVMHFEFPTRKILSYLEIGHYQNQTLFSAASTYKIQGSIDNTTWTDVTETLTYNNVATTTSGGLSNFNSNIANFPLNRTAYKYYRIFAINVVNGGGWATEIYFKENICGGDFDNDGVPNHFDLDSDGDGCPDAKEAGVSGTLEAGDITNLIGGSTTNTEVITGVNNAIAAGPYGLNGLANGLELTSESGVTSYPSTYTIYANNNTQNACLDTDNDGIANVIDIDDDNDGIIDIHEMSCTTISAPKTGMTISSDLSFTGNITTLIDGNDTTNQVHGPSGTFANTTWLKFQFPSPKILTQIEIGHYPGQTLFATTSIYKIQASNDNVNWVDITANQTYNNTAPVYATNNSAKLPMASNVNSYSYYRIQGVSGATGGGWGQEVYFTELVCTDNNTDGDANVNRLDLDSDNDGCFDAKEAGVPTDKFDASTGMVTGIVGANGLANNLETVTDNGIINYTNTYNDFAKSSTLNACIDTDNDGIPDVIDIDDDNDGIPDDLECVVPSSAATCSAANGAALTIWNSFSGGTATGTLTTNGGTATVTATSTKNFVALNNFIWGGPANQCPPPPAVNPGNYNLSTNTNNYTITFTFSRPIANPRLQSSSINTTINFPHPVRLLANSQGLTNNTMISSIAYGGSEVPFTVMYQGVYTSITVTVPGADAYGGWVIAADNIQPMGTTTFIDTTIGYQGYFPENNCDDDNDNIPNRLDLDSDNDGCFDAKEAGVPTDKFDASTGMVTGIVGANGLANNLETATDNGIINYTSTYANAINALVNNCFCTQNPNTAPATVFSMAGISTQAKRSGWPEDVANGFLVLESKNKGFVITRLTTSQRDGLTAIEGMLIYNITNTRMELYNGTAWIPLTRSCNN